MEREKSYVSMTVFLARDSFIEWFECSNGEFPDLDVKEHLAYSALEVISKLIRISTDSRFCELLSAQEICSVRDSLRFIREKEGEEFFLEAANKLMDSNIVDFSKFEAELKPREV